MHLSQLVATSVISSFVESNRHPEMQKAMPTMIIDKQVCLYDCERDKGRQCEEGFM
jgi:hypothetical protein